MGSQSARRLAMDLAYLLRKHDVIVAHFISDVMRHKIDGDMVIDI